MPGTATSGNRSAKRGSRYIQRFQVDKSTALTYKLLVTQRGWAYTPENVARIAAELAEAAWQDIDQKFEADSAWEGQVL